ncbi:hypothetical protein Tco_1212241 [Tanacetum coccineum]
MPINLFVIAQLLIRKKIPSFLPIGSGKRLLQCLEIYRWTSRSQCKVLFVSRHLPSPAGFLNHLAVIAISASACIGSARSQAASLDELRLELSSVDSCGRSGYGRSGCGGGCCPRGSSCCKTFSSKSTRNSIHVRLYGIATMMHDNAADRSVVHPGALGLGISVAIRPSAVVNELKYVV